MWPADWLLVCPLCLVLCIRFTLLHMWSTAMGLCFTRKIYIGGIDLTDYHVDCIAWYGNVSLVWVDLQYILFYFCKRIRLALSHTVNPVTVHLFPDLLSWTSDVDDSRLSVNISHHPVLAAYFMYYHTLLFIILMDTSSVASQFIWISVHQLYWMFKCTFALALFICSFFTTKRSVLQFCYIISFALSFWFLFIVGWMCAESWCFCS